MLSKYSYSRISMVLDSRGYPHIASISATAPFLFPYTNGEYLVYSYWDGAQWVHKDVDFVSTEYGGAFGSNTSIALGDDGYPRIAYVARPTKDLPAISPQFLDKHNYSLTRIKSKKLLDLYLI